MTSKKDIKPDRFVFLHDKEKVTELLKNIKLLNTDDKDVKPVDADIDVVNEQIKSLEGVSSKSCSYCQVKFESVEDQRLHYKLDWHRYNLKQSLVGKNAISEDQFGKILEDLEKDEENEISGSDNDSDEEEEENSLNYFLSRDPKVFINSNDDKIVSIYKCLLFDPKLREFPSEPELLKIIESSPKRLTWAILMLGGGHFAGAIFRGKEVLVHKTFHAYTVRAKQGGSQGSADNKSGGSHPKSAGASLRRYNEMSLMQHIQDITEVWEDHFKSCQLIFYRATSSNKNALFSGKNAVLTRNDERLRTIPFPTKRATFNEVKRVHEVLSKVEILGKVEDVDDIFERKDKKLEKSPLKKRIHRSKSREDPIRNLPQIVQDLAKEGLGDDDNCDSSALEVQEVTLSTLHLQEFESTAIKKKGKRSKNNKLGGIQNDLDELDTNSSDEEKSSESKLVKLQNELLTAVRSGNNKMLEDLVSSGKNWEDDMNLEDLLNHQFGDSKTTCLHLAAKHGHKNILWTLLVHGADPSVRDKLKKVPFMFATEKETRNMFRKFMGEYPDKYDYKTAQVPPPLSKEAEEEKAAKVNEKKKAQRLAKREKDKVQKGEEQKLKKEKEEKDRFLNLSDREKRALAAERRFLNTGGGSSAIQKQLCFSCATDITGKTPFEYADNKFCSVGCVKKHRMKNP